MKSIEKIFNINTLIIVLFVAILTACGSKGEDTPKTLLEILSKTWRISRVTINGTVDNTGNYGNYRVSFQQNGTYVVTPGGAPVNIVVNPANNGRWVITDNETSITFDQGTPNEFKITLVTKTETAFSVRFKIPRSINKTEPEYVIEFTSVQ
jgi:uncharacterized protein (UPF0333 family)